MYTHWVMSILLYECTTWTLTKRTEKKVWWKLPKDATSYIKQILEATSHKTAVVWPNTNPSWRPYKLDKQAMRDIAGRAKTNSYAMFS